MTKVFEIEYDGVYYTIEADYTVVADSFDHAFGSQAVETVLPSGFLAYVGEAQVSVVDPELRKAIWSEADRVGLSVWA